MKILIVEDNSILRENLIFLLKKNNFFWEWAENWKIALDKVNSQKFDGIILDINMPFLNGRDFLKTIRKNNNSTPVITLTSNSMLEDKLEMFDLWVDDYLTKPFETDELIARLKAILKRKEKTIDNEKIIWNIKINFSNKKVYLEEAEVFFPHKQYLIIEYLSKNFWYPQQKIKIMEYVWWEAEENLEFNSTTLESHIYAIRNKLGKNFIKTIKWIWYIIE